MWINFIFKVSRWLDKNLFVILSFKHKGTGVKVLVPSDKYIVIFLHQEWTIVSFIKSMVPEWVNVISLVPWGGCQCSFDIFVVPFFKYHLDCSIVLVKLIFVHSIDKASFVVVYNTLWSHFIFTLINIPSVACVIFLIIAITASELVIACLLHHVAFRTKISGFA